MSRRKKKSAAGVATKRGEGWRAWISVVLGERVRAIKDTLKREKRSGCARKWPVGIYTNSSRGIRRGNDSAELYRPTDQRNYRKSMEILFRRLFVSPPGLARLNPLGLLFLPCFSFFLFFSLVLHSIPRIACLRTCAHKENGALTELTEKREEAEGAKRKHRGLMDSRVDGRLF